MSLSLPEIATQLGISINIVNGLINGGKLRTTPGADADSRPYRTLDDSELRRLAVIARAYASGFSPDKALELAAKPALQKADRILAAQVAVAELLAAFRHDDDTQLHQFLRLACQLLKCERTLLFRRFSRDPDNLELDAAWHFEKGRQDRTRVTLAEPDAVSRLRKVPFGYFRQWSTSFRREGVVPNLLGTEVITSSYPEIVNTKLLKPETCYSLLVIPLTDRKHRETGYLLAENRLGPNGQASEANPFDASDESISEFLVMFWTLGLELIPHCRTLSELAQHVRRKASLREYLNAIGIEAILQSGSVGSDVHWQVGRELEIFEPCHLQSPAERAEGGSGTQRLIRPSFMAVVKDGGVPLRVASTSDARWKLLKESVRSGIQSVLCVPILRPDSSEVCGVIQVTAFEEDFFDDDDQEKLEELAVAASLYGSILENQDQVYSQWRESLQLSTILTDVEKYLGFGNGLIFRADHKEGRLVVTENSPRTKLPEEEFFYAFDDPAICTRVFRDKQAVFVEDVTQDDRASLKGLTAFGITGSLIALPLVFGNTAVGVLVVWGKTGAPVSREDVSKLKPFAELAVSRMNDLLIQDLSGTFDLSTVLHRILDRIRAAGLDRARILKFEESFNDNSDRLVCIASQGADEAVDEYRTTGLCLPLKDSRYTRHFTKMEPQTIGLLVNPTEPNWFGPAPESEKVKRPADLPWCVYPLHVDGKPFGHISADNVRSRRPIEQAQLVALARYGRIAAHAIQLDSIRNNHHGSFAAAQ